MSIYRLTACQYCKRELTPRTSREKHCSARCRFKSLVPNSIEGCWNWPLSKFKASGYGQFNDGNTTVAAHRFSYEVFVGPIPTGLIVRHRCDNRGCFNPGHLEVGTHSDNTRDMYERKRAGERWRSGERHHNAKLSDLEVEEIKASTDATRVLAERYSVSTSNIRQIRSGRTRVSARRCQQEMQAIA